LVSCHCYIGFRKQKLTTTIGGFTVTYFQLKWVARDGPAVVFGVQGALVGAVIVAIIVTLIFGEKWRAKYPAPAEADD
jgi:hypothetical protein